MKKRISKKRAFELMNDTCKKHKFFTAVFTKKDGSERTINCLMLPEQNSTFLGYVTVKDIQKVRQQRHGVDTKGVIRRINLQTLKKLKILGEEYDLV